MIYNNQNYIIGFVSKMFDFFTYCIFFVSIICCYFAYNMIFLKDIIVMNVYKNT